MQAHFLPRLGAASGIAFVALLFGAGSLGIVAEIVALLFLLPFVGYLSSVLRRAEGEGGWLSATALGAALVALAIKLGSGTFIIAADTTEVGPALDETLTAANNAAFMLSLAPLGVMVGAAAIVALRTSVLPRWLGVLSAVTAAALIANSTFVEADFGPAFLLFAVWTLATSVTLVRGTPTTIATAPQPQPA